MTRFLLPLALLILAACQPAPHFESRGVVQSIDGTAITIDHEPIPGFMNEAMAMDFNLKSASVASRIQPGDTVAFDLGIDAQGAAITSMTKLSGVADLNVGGMARSQAPSRMQMAGGGHGHGGGSGVSPDRTGFTARVDGLRIDLADPPGGSNVGRAMAFVGDAYVHVAYSRPFKRGRVIFGGLVGYDQVWATGAHYATEITLTKPLLVDGQQLAAGTYSMSTVPGRNTWEVNFNTVLGMHMADDYDPANNALTVYIPAESLSEVVEQHTIDFAATERGADLRIQWDQTGISVPLEPMP
ncbi:MAG: hypothetical protein RhofKO_30460 [Rhodothermales bacterium]